MAEGSDFKFKVPKTPISRHTTGVKSRLGLRLLGASVWVEEMALRDTQSTVGVELLGKLLLQVSMLRDVGSIVSMPSSEL